MNTKSFLKQPSQPVTNSCNLITNCNTINNNSYSKHQQPVMLYIQINLYINTISIFKLTKTLYIYKIVPIQGKCAFLKIIYHKLSNEHKKILQ